MGSISAASALQRPVRLHGIQLARPTDLLLDREADKFLARRSTADAMLVKPIDPGTLRRTVKNLLAAAQTPSGPEEEVG